MYHHDLYYRQALERAEAIRKEIEKERLIPKKSLRASLALHLHQLAHKLEPSLAAEENLGF